MANRFPSDAKSVEDWFAERANRHDSRLNRLEISKLGKVWIDPAICKPGYTFVNDWDQAGDPYETFAYRLYDVNNLQVKGTLTGGTTGTHAFKLLEPFWPKKDISIYGNVEVTAQVLIAILQIDHLTGWVTVNFDAPV